MKEYGGYIEFERFHGKMLHEQAIDLNCGRNALAYLCLNKKIEKIYFPYYICDSVTNICQKIGEQFEYYHISPNFEPVFDANLGANHWIYIINYYVQLDNEKIKKIKQRYQRVIIDNAQSYFQLPIPNTDTIYTCRKYFGVSDGAFLYSDCKVNESIPTDESRERMNFSIGRLERSANAFYKEYVANNKMFATEPIKKMSLITKNILCGIDYEKVAEIREENFAYLQRKLQDINLLELSIPKGAFMYPLLIKEGMEVRRKLQQEKIYVPLLWPNVLETCKTEDLEYKYAAGILPLPVDQRYKLEDMRYIVKRVKEKIKEL